MADAIPTKSRGRAPAQSGRTAPDSGVWARPGAGARRRQEGPLGGAARLPAWLGWCLALSCCVAVAALLLGTLLELTRELMELGHPGVRAGVDAR